MMFDRSELDLPSLTVILNPFYFRSREEVLQAISPYFAVDFLLPRTYVASLSFYHLSNIDLELVLTDAVLGAICYFIKTCTSRQLDGEKFQVRKTGSSLTLTSVIVFLKRHFIRKNRNHFVILKCFCNNLLWLTVLVK
jgi:hypothetical protein